MYNKRSVLKSSLIGWTDWLREVQKSYNISSWASFSSKRWSIRSSSYFHCAIKYGNSESFSYLGKHYELGLGINEDETKAFRLYMNGAELEDPQCVYLVGNCFRNGYCIEEDDVMGYEYYEKAADAGHITGLHQVGWCLQNGVGTEVDVAEGVKYFKAAA